MRGEGGSVVIDDESVGATVIAGVTYRLLNNPCPGFCRGDPYHGGGSGSRSPPRNGNSFSGKTNYVRFIWVSLAGQEPNISKVSLSYQNAARLCRCSMPAYSDNSLQAADRQKDVRFHQWQV